MRLPRVWTSLSRTMIAVMIVALSLCVWRMWERMVYCQRRAAYWGARERSALKWATELEAATDEAWRRWAATERESAGRYRSLRVKYEIGGTHPWSHVAPDPGEFRGRVHPEVGFIREGLEGE